MLSKHCAACAAIEGAWAPHCKSTRVCERAELTLTFMEVGARAVISLFILSAMPGNIVVPACTTVHVNHPAKTIYTHCPTCSPCAQMGVEPYTSVQMCTSPAPAYSGVLVSGHGTEQAAVLR